MTGRLEQKEWWGILFMMESKWDYLSADGKEGGEEGGSEDIGKR